MKQTQQTSTRQCQGEIRQTMKRFKLAHVQHTQWSKRLLEEQAVQQQECATVNNKLALITSRFGLIIVDTQKRKNAIW